MNVYHKLSLLTKFQPSMSIWRETSPEIALKTVPLAFVGQITSTSNVETHTHDRPGLGQLKYECTP